MADATVYQAVHPSNGSGFRRTVPAADSAGSGGSTAAGSDGQFVRLDGDEMNGPLQVPELTVEDLAGAGQRLVVANEYGDQIAVDQAVWTPEVPEVPIVPYASYVASYDSFYTGANSPWGLDASADKIFWSSAYDWSFGDYNGTVVVFDRATGTYSHFGPPTPTMAGTNQGFGSGLAVVGAYLYVGAYGWNYYTSSVGRIYKYDTATLTLVATLDVPITAPAGGELGRANAIAGDPATGVLFTSYNQTYGAGEILIWSGDVYAGTFTITGAAGFGNWIWLSPDGHWLTAGNKTSTGAASELVILSVSGTTLAEVQRIANPGTANFWGCRVRWDADSLGFWSTTSGGGLSYHYRWDGSQFSAVTAATFTGAKQVCEANTPTQVYVEYSDTVTLCDSTTGAVIYTWTGKADSNGYQLLRRIGTQFLVQHGTSQGVGIGSAEIPAVLPILDLAADLEAESLKITDQAGTGERMLVAQPDGTHRDVDEVTWDGTDVAVSGDPLTTRSRAIAYALIFG